MSACGCTFSARRSRRLGRRVWLGGRGLWGGGRLIWMSSEGLCWWSCCMASHSLRCSLHLCSIVQILDHLVVLSALSPLPTHTVRRSSRSFFRHDLGVFAASSIKHISIHKFRKFPARACERPRHACEYPQYKRAFGKQPRSNPNFSFLPSLSRNQEGSASGSPSST